MAKSKKARRPVNPMVFAVLIVFTASGLLRAQTNLSIGDVQVLNIDQNRICQHVYENGEYKLAWQSAPLEGSASVRLGDVDNDGAKEIVASVLYQTWTETVKVSKKPTTRTWGSFRIEIFEDGITYGGGPSWFYDIPGEVLESLPNDSYIGDVDNDGDNDLVLIRSTELEAFHFPGEDTVPVLDHICTYPSFLSSLQVGDADNLGDNELIVVPGRSSLLRIWKRLPGGWEQKTAEPVPSSLWGPGYSYCGVTYMRVRDADNAPGNEIIATGNNARLMVWKYEGGSYKLTSVSADLNANMAFGLDSGNIDGDTSNAHEVVINLWGTKRWPARIVVLTFDGGVWVQKNIYNCPYADLRDLRVGDLDGDGKAEVALQCNGPTPGFRILRFAGDLLTGTFSEVYVGPGDPYYKIEIR